MKYGVLMVFFQLLFAGAYARNINRTDTVKHAVDTTTKPGHLPRFISTNKKPGKNDFVMHCGPYKPDKSHQPLIIVDGVKTSYRKLQKIDIKTIKTISIIKDSALLAPYGKKGKNGALIVTTAQKK